MSKTDSMDSELPEQITTGIRDTEYKRQWVGIKQELANQWGVPVGKVTHADVCRELLESYQFRRLEEHQQVWQQAERAVADVLDTDPDDLTRATVARELAEGYIGRDACGRWRDRE